MAKTRLRRGVKTYVEGLTDSLTGEPILTLDTDEMYVGQPDGTTAPLRIRVENVTGYVPGGGGSVNLTALADGTAVSPTIAFASGTAGTGMFAWEDHLAWATQGVHRMTLNWAGNLGIGPAAVANPNLARLMVDGDQYATGAYGWYVPGEGGARLAVYRGGTDFFIFRCYSQIYTIQQIWTGPSVTASSDGEATLALVRGNEPNVELMDVYNMRYAGVEAQMGFRLQKRGTGEYLPFVIDRFDSVTKIPLMRIDPVTNNVSIGTYTDNGVDKLQVEGSVKAKGPVAPGSYTVATLPTGVGGQLAFATDGRKSGEGAGSGTGCLVCFSNGQWRRVTDETVVAA